MKRAAAIVPAVALAVALGCWVGVRQMDRDACLSLGGGRGESALEPYKGESLSEARARASRDGDVLRVVGEDGECFERTSDARDDRVNVYLEDGRVADVEDG